MSQPGMLASLRELFSHVSPRRRRQLVPVLLLMLAGAFAELVSIGAILPFLALIADPSGAASGPLGPLFGALGLSTPVEVVLAAAVVFALAAVVAGAVRLLLVWISQRFVFGVAHELSTAVYRRVLYQNYAWHTAHNTSETLAAINKTQIVANGLLVPLMQGLSAGVIALFIVLGLLIIDPAVALISGLGFAAIYLLVMATTRAVMRRNGIILAEAQEQRVQAASEGLGGIRDVLLDHSQPVFVARFDDVETGLRRAMAANNFIAAAPRFIVEGLGLVLIAMMAMALSLGTGGLLGALPVLGALALGAQRLLPLLQLLYQGWAASMNNGPILQDILGILRLPEAPHCNAPRQLASLSFDRAITLEHVSFHYPAGNRLALGDVSLVIPKGSRVALIGKTGSGKSTMVDLVLGLLTPTAGRILIDGVELTDANRSAWQAQIAHVPQFIYLSDATVAENIAFGVPRAQIDQMRVARAAQQAELAEVVNALPQGYGTIVGERGIRLSGGQRQRIGIARALYKHATILVFDEATNALDTETEAIVMRAINGLDRSLTILMITHRLATVEGADLLTFSLAGGRLIETQEQKQYNQQAVEK